jgi:hypothetical protein
LDATSFEEKFTAVGNKKQASETSRIYNIVEGSPMQTNIVGKMVDEIAAKMKVRMNTRLIFSLLQRNTFIN